MKEDAKRILFVSGTRADFGKLKPLIQRVKESDRFTYSIFATGMHMLARYGSTRLEITQAGFESVHPFINQDSSVNSQMDLVLANTIQGLGHYIREFSPDMVVTHGDRVETLAAAIAGTLNNVLVAHVEGGEVSGTVDELIRHSVTKLSHLHFVSNDQARLRLIQMGELREAVFVVGSPDIDIMLSDQLPTFETVKARYEIPFDDYAIVLYHPVTSELTDLQEHVDELLCGLESAELKYVVIYPNNDTGSELILKAFRRFDGNLDARLIPSMRFEYFLTLLKHARAIVGNSSAGIREAPVYGVPTVNVGTRQMNRFHYPSIVNVADDAREISHALANLPETVVPSRHFGYGDSADRFMRVLEQPALWRTRRQKQFRDVPFQDDGERVVLVEA
jgi:UDP-N-acetylglucosamine 2-epimerase (hydrolysing)